MKFLEKNVFKWPYHCISSCCYILFPIINTPSCTISLYKLAILCN